MKGKENKMKEIIVNSDKLNKAIWISDSRLSVYVSDEVAREIKLTTNKFYNIELYNGSYYKEDDDGYGRGNLGYRYQVFVYECDNFGKQAINTLENYEGTYYSAYYRSEQAYYLSGKFMRNPELVIEEILQRYIKNSNPA